jgi:predicted nuclease with TOPRIM domain
MNSNIKGTGLQDLYDALLRLVDNKPMRIGKGFKISLRTVALEAGKDPSLIRKDRDIYDHLIADIEHYAALQKEKSAKKNGQVAELKARIAKLRSEAERFEDLWKAALARELCLLEQLDEYEQRWKKYTNVVDLVPNNSPANH